MFKFRIEIFSEIALYQCAHFKHPPESSMNIGSANGLLPKTARSVKDAFPLIHSKITRVNAVVGGSYPWYLDV